MSALFNRDFKDDLSEEVTCQQRNTSVKVRSKIGEDLGKSFKRRSNSKYEVTIVEAHLMCFRNSSEPISLEANEHCEVRVVTGEQFI